MLFIITGLTGEISKKAKPGVEMILGGVQHLEIYDMNFDEKLFDAIEKQIVDREI